MSAVIIAAERLEAKRTEREERRREREALKGSILETADETECVRDVQTKGTPQMTEIELSTLTGSSEETVWNRGHGPKILEATRSAQAKGRLPANLRPVEYRRVVVDELKALGYADARVTPPPSRTALDERYDVIYRANKL